MKLTTLTILIAAAVLAPLSVCATVQTEAKAPGGGMETLTLKNPEGLFFDSKDRLLVADTGNNRILVFSPQLALIGTIGQEGQGEGQFRQPADVAVDSRGRIIVADAGNNRIVVLDVNGRFVSTFGSAGKEDGQFNRPSNVTVDERDNIIVTDRFNFRLQVFDRNGTHLFTLANREGEKNAERIALEKQWAIEREPNKRPEEIEVNPKWESTDTGQFNEPGGTWYDAKAKELWLANGWNCRYERFDYDSRTGEIRRKTNEAIDGIVWGPWITRNCTGTPDGRLIGLQTAWGGLQVYSNRSRLTSLSQMDREVHGGSYGEMKDVHDLAVNSAGEIAVADSANSRIVIFNKDFTMPPSPGVDWLSADGGKITWRTGKPCPTQLVLRYGLYPERTPGRENPWTDGKDEVRLMPVSARPVIEHEAVLSGLRPAARYYYKVAIPEMKTIPGAGWSREYAITTHAREGETEYLGFTLKTLLLPNVVNVESVRADTEFPEKMSASDIERYYKAQWRQTVLFYWINSHMKYWIDHDVYVDETMYRSGDMNKGRFKDDAERERYASLPEPNHGASFDRLIGEAGNENKVYFGQMLCTCIVDWQEGGKTWAFRGSGGGTYGIEWPTPGRTDYLGGSDVAWLMCHEYKHQVESNYGVSGLDKPEDRMWFCHFSPVFPGWDQASSDDHGEHWDGIAWQLRHHKRDSYLRAMYSNVYTAVDADGDGIPDNDPRVPLDERRLGSNPQSPDTDSDGLADMDELLASTWVRAMLTDVRSRVEVDYIRPNLNSPDSDGDGLTDGIDKYPIHPYATEITKGTATVDGMLDEWTGKPQIAFSAEGVTIEVWSRWNNTNTSPEQEPDVNDALFYAVRVTGLWTNLSFVVDLKADGFYSGNDNLYVEIAPNADNGPTLRNARMHMCDLGRWPWFDDQHVYLRPDELRFASSVKDGQQVFELAVPRRDILGLYLKRGEEIGLMLYIGLPGKGPISVFEPYQIFDSTLVE
ncbi:MAG: 6-bladed beta-propeller [Verrucomicrobia bacterium]|nr:6-bladed beta-propeller [Verrucomicrobiota bacterium]